METANLVKEYRRLRQMDFKPADATRVAKFRASWIGHIGDICWEDHSGGPVYADPDYPGQYRLAYVEPPYDGEDECWHVYDIDLDAHALADCLGLDFASRQMPLEPPSELESIADCCGQDWQEYANAIWSGNPIALAHVAQDIAAYGGWENALNADPQDMTRDEFVAWCGEEPSRMD